MWKSEKDMGIVCNIPIRDTGTGKTLYRSKIYIGIGEYGEVYKMFCVDFGNWKSWFNSDSNDDDNNFCASDNISYSIVLLTEYPYSFIVANLSLPRS